MSATLARYGTVLRCYDNRGRDPADLNRYRASREA